MEISIDRRKNRKIKRREEKMAKEKEKKKKAIETERQIDR